MKNVIKVSAKEIVRLEGIEKLAKVPRELKGFKAAVLSGKDGNPKYFVFDTYSLWNFLCVVDEKYEEKMTAKEYITQNPIGWLIDAIETKLPVNPKLVAKLRKSIEEAKKSGLIPFEKVIGKLGLA